MLFIRSVPRRDADRIAVFAGTSTRERTELRRLEIERYDDLCALDFETAGEPVEHPLFLVCTHGKHDRCCAVQGRPVFEALREQVEESWVWQSSHVGGDRFAGNVVALPDGVYYGRVEPAETWPLVEAVLAGRVYAPLYRGRSRYGFAAQAAELAVREETGRLGVDDVHVDSIRRQDEGWEAVVAAGGSRYDVGVHLEEGEPAHLTCSTNRLSRPRRYVAGSPRARVS